MTKRSEKQVDGFYKSKPWFGVRKQAMFRDAKRGCGLCGLPFRPGQKLQVDHTIPRKQRPDLELHLPNLRTVHAECHSRHTHTQAPDVGPDGFPADGSWGEA